MTIVALLLAAQAANVPELPKDVPASAAKYTVTMMGQAAGQQAVWTEGGRLRAFFQFNDRGRGPRTYATLSLRDGVPVSETVEGVDYMKDPVKETFSVQGGSASWKSKAEQGSQKLQRPAFYVAMYGPPSDFALLVKAALANGGSIALLPGGEARVRKVREQEAKAAASSASIVLYEVSGLDFSPLYFWLDGKGEMFASASTWLAVVREGFESTIPALLEVQQQADRERNTERAARLAHRPKGKVVFHDATLFDAEIARMVPHQDVVVDGKRIVEVAPTGAPHPGAEVIECAGKALIPGLWDMHAHVSPNDGLLNLAAGVTSVRDLANDTDDLIARKKRIEEGTELGTRIVMAGFMDGPGPYQGPTKVLVADEKTGREWVDKYASLGMVQIKLYSSLKPELVAPIAEEAHRLGLRVSGHIPAGLTASEAVKLGYDEIQHVNFLVLNFMPDVKDTRTPARFLEPAKRAADLDLGSEQVRAFIALLRDRHTALDPTLGAFETLFLDRPGEMSVGYRAVADRLPVQIRRGFLAGSLPVPEGMDERYKASWKKMLGLVRELYTAGVPIEAGTDAMAGFGLHRELELDVEAGIPAPEVLRLATLGAAHVVGLDHDLGSIRPGKLADLVLVDGDPAAHIPDVRKPVITMKDGVVYRPAELWREIGVRP